jgi:hypothetical protein
MNFSPPACSISTRAITCRNVIVGSARCPPGKVLAQCSSEVKEGGDGLHPLPSLLGRDRPGRRVETHQRWDAVRHEDGRADLRLADELAVARGSHGDAGPAQGILIHGEHAAARPSHRGASLPVHQLASAWLVICLARCRSTANRTPRSTTA